MSLSFRWALRSDVGLVRTNNEDCAYARPDLLVLADGMGGHAGGEVASAVALNAYAAATFDAATDTDPSDTLAAAAATTRSTLRAMSGADESLATMGTTTVAIAHTGERSWISHIGDSRIYLLRDGEMTQLTTDHTHVQHLVKIGKITPLEVHSHPYRAMLLRSLDDQGGGAAPDIFPVDLHVGDRVLLCSDGLSDYVARERIAHALATAGLDDAADALVEVALRGGTRDNVTVVVADVSDGSADEAPEFTGAAAFPLRVSAAAEDALTEAFPGFTHAVGVDRHLPDSVANTTPLPALTPDSGVPRARTPQAPPMPIDGDSEPALVGQAPRPPQSQLPRTPVPVAAILAGIVILGVLAATSYLLP